MASVVSMSEAIEEAFFRGVNDDGLDQVLVLLSRCVEAIVGVLSDLFRSFKLIRSPGHLYADSCTPDNGVI